MKRLVTIFGICFAAQAIFAAQPALIIVSGSVVDAETHQPITAFTVTPGVGPGDPDLLHWLSEKAQRAQNGRYHIELAGMGVLGVNAIMVEAPGYLPEMMSSVRRTNTTWNFELHKGNGFSATVLGPDGRAMEGAQAAYILKWGGLQLDGHKIIIRQWPTHPAGFLEWQQTPLSKTDAQGRFTIPGMPGIESLIIFHPDGFAQIPREILSQTRVVHLQPWTNTAVAAGEKRLKVRLNARQTEWPSGTTPQLAVEIRNEGGAKLLSSADRRLWRIEVDGTWYGLHLWAGSLSELKADHSWTKGILTLDGQWFRVAEQFFDTTGGAMYGQADVWNLMTSASPLTLSPGKHIIRLAVFAVEAAPETTGTIEAISNPVEIGTAAPSVKEKAPDVKR